MTRRNSALGQGLKLGTGAGSDGLSGAVVDQTLPVLVSYGNSADRHARVLHALPSSSQKAVKQDA